MAHRLRNTDLEGRRNSDHNSRLSQIKKLPKLLHLFTSIYGSHLAYRCPGMASNIC